MLSSKVPFSFLLAQPPKTSADPTYFALCSPRYGADCLITTDTE